MRQPWDILGVQHCRSCEGQLMGLEKGRGACRILQAVEEDDPGICFYVGLLYDLMMTRTVVCWRQVTRIHSG